MKKFLISFLLLPMIIYSSACSSTKEETKEHSTKGFAAETADVWTPTFQLCWNELINFLGTPTVEYINGNPELANELNKQKFVKSDLNPNDYYTSVTKQTLKHKKEIEKAIKQKFNETSDILGEFIFPDVSDRETNQWFIYSILIKNFPFIAYFDNLEPEGFNNNNSEIKYKYFGFDYTKKENSENRKALKKAITPLFYANDEDFALSITDKTEKEEMILYLTSSDSSFDEIYEEVKNKTSHSEEYKQKRTEQAKQGKDDRKYEVIFHSDYKFPYLKIDNTLDFDKELAGKPIKNNNGEDIVITSTIQTIKFKLDNTGAKLKSEAAISFKNTASFIPKIVIEDNYYFNRPFVIFLKEKNKEKPYFAAKIKDGKYLVEEK